MTATTRPQVATTRPPAPPITTTTAATTTTARITTVTAPGTFDDFALEIRLAFRSEVADVSAAELERSAMSILNDPAGWSRAGYRFVADPDSELTVVLAEGARVDALCLPLETYGTVNCQNGPVVALNAARWRNAWRGWDDTVEAYRFYVVTHEVGHLIGLRHPAGRCPDGATRSAAMDPQTRTTLHCPGNGVPLDWEIEWASRRPAVIGPTPEWDGPRPEWP